MKSLFAPLIVVVLLQATAAAVEMLRPAEVDAWREQHPDAVLVDIRTAREFAGGHIAGVEHVVWAGRAAQRREFEQRLRETFGPDRPILLICRSGRRTSEAAQWLEAAGFTRVADLRGGMLAWQKADKPVNIPHP